MIGELHNSWIGELHNSVPAPRAGKERRQELKKRLLAMPRVQHVEALRDPQLPFLARVPDWNQI